MGTLIEFECRPPVGGFDIVAFDQRKARRTSDDYTRSMSRTDDGFRLVVQRKPGVPISDSKSLRLAGDATDDEQYVAQRWGNDIMILGAGDERGVVYMLRPRSERTRRFNLSERGQNVFVEFAQATNDASLSAFIQGNPDAFCEDVKRFADLYGLIEDQDLFGSHVRTWAVAIIAMRQALIAWDEAQKTGDCSKLIRILQKREIYNRDRAAGLGAKVLLTKDPITASPRVCIRPSGLHNALFTQLAFAVDGQLDLRSCIQCRSWFTLETGKGRVDKKYCSDACRMRAYRKRKGS